jgi:hypothetical protein
VIITASPSIERNHVAQDMKSNLIRDARLLLDAVGLTRGGNWISRVVRDYLSAPVQGLPFGMFLTAQVELNDIQRRHLAERADLRYLLTYSDPTGEAAIRRVMKERGW